MKSITFNLMVCGLLWGAMCSAVGAPSQNTGAPKVDEVPGHKSPFISTFNDNLGYGKDPFFPKSTRRTQSATVNTNTNFQGELPPGLVLKGLSGTTQKRLAVINNYTFAAGEEAEVRAGNQIFRVRCVEIKERAVVISVNGTPPRELALRQGVY